MFDFVLIALWQNKRQIFEEEDKELLNRTWIFLYVVKCVESLTRFIKHDYICIN
jgi:hypothetical protein